MADEKEKNTTGAKNLSKFAMAFSGLWIAILTVCKGIGFIDLSMNDICLSGVVIVAVWTPTYFSIILDKIKDIKLGL